ncbi:hypothetical protein [Thalassiella azotivora]
MPATRLTQLRSSTRTRPAVRSATSSEQLERSLRRLGADERTVALVDGSRANGHPVSRRRDDA